MNCLPCFNNDDEEEETSDPQTKDNAQLEAAASSSNAQTFNFRELAMATKNFRQECLIGEGGFGRVFKGKLHSSGKVVAVKQLDRNGMQGNKEFLLEVLMLSLIQHPNLVSLIGYCADGDQRLLVYEYLEMGSLENHLFDDNPDKKPMDWVTRMRIASGAANGLEYLHEKANPPIIYRDLKPSNILLDETLEPKLSDFGLAKLAAGGGKVNPTSRVMDTYGYSAPEYSSGGELTVKSDIYSFGVVLLELITGRRAVDTTRPNDEQNLVTWAQPIFREPKRFPDLADPRLNSEFPMTSLNQAVGICAMCLQEEPCVRPFIADVVAALSFLALPQSVPAPAPAPPLENTHTPPSEQKMEYETETNQPVQSNNDRNSKESESSESESNQLHEESSQISRGENDSSTRSSERESERQDSDRRQSFDNNLGEESIYSDSDSEVDETNFNDAETTELEDSGRSRSGNSSTNFSLYSAQSTDSSLKSDSGNKSSKHESSKRSSPTQRTSSRRRKPIVTFKEPSLSAKKNGTKKPEGENISSDNSNKTESASSATDSRQKQKNSSSSSSSDSSSESEDEKESSRLEKEAKSSPKETTPKDNNYGEASGSTKNEEKGKSEKVVPKLRHLTTR